MKLSAACAVVLRNVFFYEASLFLLFNSLSCHSIIYTFQEYRKSRPDQAGKK